MGNRSRRGFCQLIAGGCVLVMLIGLVIVGAMSYYGFRHFYPKHGPVPAVASSPAPNLENTPIPPLSLQPSSTPTPLAGPPTAPPELTWTGKLSLRGKEAPVENRSGNFYASLLDLAKVLTPAELDRVHREDGTLFLDRAPIGTVLMSHNQELVPLNELFHKLNFQTQSNEAAHILVVKGKV